MNALVLAGVGLLLAYTFYVLRLIKSLPWLNTYFPNSRCGSCSTKSDPLEMFVFLGSGGHTGEMLRILENYEATLLDKCGRLHVGYSDNGSKIRFEYFLTRHCQNIATDVRYYKFDKAREVDSSIFRSGFTIIRTLCRSFLHTLVIRQSLKRRPHLILLNGPGTCCVLALWFKLWEILDVNTNDKCNMVYVESLARINTLSLTGHILYYMSDLFIVQWPELSAKYPRSKNFGILT